MDPFDIYFTGQVAGLVHDLGKLLYMFGSEYVTSVLLTLDFIDAPTSQRSMGRRRCT